MHLINFLSVFPGVSDVENPHVKKYNVSGAQNSSGRLRISKLVCFFLVMGAILLAVLAALAVYFFAPHECDASSAPAALTKASIIPSLDRKQSPVVKMVAGDSVPQEFAKNIDILLKRLPRDVKPTHYT